MIDCEMRLMESETEQANSSAQASPAPSRAVIRNCEFSGLCIIIPTRNRADLAIRAIRSCLAACTDERLTIIVSDNSTEDHEIRRLHGFTQCTADRRLTYIRPPAPMAMHEHWDWLFSQALTRFDASHFTVLADRRLYRNGALEELTTLLEYHPDELLLFRFVDVMDLQVPVRFERGPFSGKLVRFDTRDILRAASRMRGLALTVPTPFVTCIPRRVFDQVRQSFGDYCQSNSPDFCFGFRALGVEKTILLYDKKLQISAGMNRSNGLGICRGVKTKDVVDYFANLKGRGYCEECPIPNILTGRNGMINEYCLVKRQSASNSFPEINMEDYLRMLHDDLFMIEDLEIKIQYSQILAKNGWKGYAPQPKPSVLPQRKRSLRHKVSDALANGLKPLWYVLATRFGVRPPKWLEFEFPTAERAIQFAAKFSDPQVQNTDHLTRELGNIALAEV